jgi:hypothetical protein
MARLRACFRRGIVQHFFTNRSKHSKLGAQWAKQRERYMFQLSDASSTTVFGVVAATLQHCVTIAVASEQHLNSSRTSSMVNTEPNVACEGALESLKHALSDR